MMMIPVVLVVLALIAIFIVTNLRVKDKGNRPE